jgi:hypothetical protein
MSPSKSTRVVDVAAIGAKLSASTTYSIIVSSTSSLPSPLVQPPVSTHTASATHVLALVAQVALRQQTFDV